MSDDNVQMTPPTAHKAVRSGAAHTVTSTTLRAVGAVAMVAATAAVTMPAGMPATAANAFTSLFGTAAEGIWRADGHGTVVVVRQGLLRTFDTTSTGCSPGVQAARQAGRPAADGTVRFSGDDGRPLLTVRPQGTGKAWMRFDGSVGDVGLRRLSRLPAGCAGTASAVARPESAGTARP